jgi:hypothetical protein
MLKSPMITNPAVTETRKVRGQSESLPIDAIEVLLPLPVPSFKAKYPLSASEQLGRGQCRTTGPDAEGS